MNPNENVPVPEDASGITAVTEDASGITAVTEDASGIVTAPEVDASVGVREVEVLDPSAGWHGNRLYSPNPAPHGRLYGFIEPSPAIHPDAGDVLPMWGAVRRTAEHDEIHLGLFRTVEEARGAVEACYAAASPSAAPLSPSIEEMAGIASGDQLPSRAIFADFERGLVVIGESDFDVDEAQEVIDQAAKARVELLEIPGYLWWHADEMQGGILAPFPELPMNTVMVLTPEDRGQVVLASVVCDDAYTFMPMIVDTPKQLEIAPSLNLARVAIAQHFRFRKKTAVE